MARKILGQTVSPTGWFDYLWKILSPTAKRAAITLLTGTMQMSERFACKVVGLSRSSYRRLPLAQTPDDPDADLRAERRGYSRKYPRHGSVGRGRGCATTRAPW